MAERTFRLTLKPDAGNSAVGKQVISRKAYLRGIAFLFYYKEEIK